MSSAGIATGIGARLKDEAARLGFDAVGIAPAVAPPGYESYRRWLAAGYAAGMGYLERGADARADAGSVLEGVRSIVVCAWVYAPAEADGPLGPTQGRVARYARGGDYHELFRRRLESLGAWLEQEKPGARSRAVSDTAPLLERDFARLAGLGWVGKNTMLIGRKLGSYTLLGALLTDAELEYDAPHESSHCGTCTRCLDACPTDAFPEPGVLDASRCLSYWTIEHRGVIPDEIAERLDGWVFGCDVCQEVCPWNRKAPGAREPGLAARDEWTDPDLVGWITGEREELRGSMRGTALSRAKPAGLIRNAALVLGGRRAAEAVPGLLRLLADRDASLRISAAWALGKIGGEAAKAALGDTLNDEDPAVREAVRRALDFCPEDG